MAIQTSTPAFLDEGHIARNGAEAGLDEAAIQTLCLLARRIAGDSQLRLVAGAAHHAVYETNADFTEAVRQADSALGTEADVLHALFVLDTLRLVRERQAARGVPGTITQAVNQRHGIAWLQGAAARGQIGIANWLPGWFRLVAGGELYRLGRLEFAPQKWDYPFRAYTHMRTGEVIVLAEGGLGFVDDGTLMSTPGWKATLIETEDAITGTPIAPHGVALHQLVRLPRDEWQLALGPGDPVLDIHVPSEGALTIEALRDALAQAEPFFDHYYPDQRFVAYICDSWLFSSQLEAMLGPESNIVRWQREGYLLPGEGGQEYFLEFTFGAREIDRATAPRDTHLRRAIIAHLEQGGSLRCGEYLLLRRDLGRFGSQSYREASMQAIKRLEMRD